MVRGQWVYAGGRAGNKPRCEEKIAITTACESLIADVLLPKSGTSERPRARRCSRCATADAGDVPSSAVLATGRR